jgi:hypothetical protein
MGAGGGDLGRGVGAGWTDGGRLVRWQGWSGESGDGGPPDSPSQPFGKGRASGEDSAGLSDKDRVDVDCRVGVGGGREVVCSGRFGMCRVVVIIVGRHWFLVGA